MVDFISINFFCNKDDYLNKLNNYTFGILFLGILYVLIFNLFHYDQGQGYDGEAHQAYINNFFNMYGPNKSSQPSVNFTYEFFSPPLGYLFPAILNSVCRNFLSDTESCIVFYGFNNILFQSILFIFTLFIYIKIIELIQGNKNKFNIHVLLLLGIFTVNYRTVAMIRGETLILFFNSLLMYKFIQLLQKSFEYKKKDLLIVGILIGSLALSRQWAFLLFPGYIFLLFYIKNSEIRKKYFKFFFTSSIIGFATSSWFYINLFFEYGSFTAFNIKNSGFKLSNQPLSFYIPQGPEVGMVFTKPIRPFFENQFFPVLYSDLWGDYWGYFTFTSRALDVGKNQLLIGDYLARVNILSLIPTLLLIIGVIHAIKEIKTKENTTKYFLTYVLLSSAISLIGYLWFLISHPEPSGDTIKATYIIQFFHLLGLSSVVYLENLKERSKNLYKIYIVLLIIVFANNFSALMSHFPLNDLLYEVQYNISWES